MKKFDGVLLITDWDGTLSTASGVSEENINAIKYFQDNGGIFTVCSGRAISFLAEHMGNIIPNTYVICYNGAYIVNPKTSEMLYKSTCDETMFDIIDKLFIHGNEYERIYMHRTDMPSADSYSPEEYLKNFEEIKTHEYFKAVLYAKNDESGDKGIVRALEYSFDGYTVVRSFRKGIEILKEENTKGEALKRLAKYHNSTLTVAVGDYDNDISMILAADVGFAVENAQESVKLSSDRITVDCTQSAIAKVIDEIEFEILPKIK